MITARNLYDLLLKFKIADKAKLDIVLKDAKRNEKTFYFSVLNSALVTPEHLVKLCSEFLNIPTVSISDIEIDPSVAKELDEKTAHEIGAVVYGKEKGKYLIAIVDPESDDVEPKLKKLLGKNFTLALTTPRDLESALLVYKRDLSKTFQELIKKTTKIAASNAIDEAPIIKIIDTLLEYAIAERASDIHIEPRQDITVVRYRIDGILNEIVRLNSSLHAALIARLKVMSELRLDENRAPQDGRFSVDSSGKQVSCRISIMSSMHGSKAVVRILPESAHTATLEELGLSGESLRRVSDSISKTMGIVLATGPTGSGKTSTLYSLLKMLDSNVLNISTIEDPVEYEVSGVNQFQVNSTVGLTFANGLRSLLRQDPNVLMVGEIRDEETASIAMNSALTGHFVLSTLHTTSAAGVLPRLIDMKVEPYIVASTVSAIIAQRLVRRVCTNCITLYAPDKSTLAELKFLAPKNVISRLPHELYRGAGCEKCRGLGYKGRIGIFEVITVSEGLKKLISDRATEPELHDQAVKEGMVTMLLDGIDKVERGITTVEELLRVLRE